MARLVRTALGRNFSPGRLETCILTEAACEQVCEVRAREKLRPLRFGAMGADGGAPERGNAGPRAPSLGARARKRPVSAGRPPLVLVS